jgi:hypothetical protein
LNKYKKQPTNGKNKLWRSKMNAKYLVFERAMNWFSLKRKGSQPHRRRLSSNEILPRLVSKMAIILEKKIMDKRMENRYMRQLKIKSLCNFGWVWWG